MYHGRRTPTYETPESSSRLHAAPAGCHGGMTTSAAISDRPITQSADILHSAVTGARARTYNAQITEPFRRLIRHVRFWQYFGNKLPLIILYGCLEKISVVLRTTPLSWSNVIAWERVEHVLRTRRCIECSRASGQERVADGKVSGPRVLRYRLLFQWRWA